MQYHNVVLKCGMATWRQQNPYGSSSNTCFLFLRPEKYGNDDRGVRKRSTFHSSIERGKRKLSRERARKNLGQQHVEKVRRNTASFTEGTASILHKNPF